VCLTGGCFGRSMWIELQIQNLTTDKKTQASVLYLSTNKRCCFSFLPCKITFDVGISYGKLSLSTPEGLETFAKVPRSVKLHNKNETPV